MIRKVAPNHQSLLSSLKYDKVTGWFIRRKNGKRAGCKTTDGYRVIHLDGAQYYEHHLAWYYTYGIWPDFIDHKNRKRHENWLDNLRTATSSQNRINTETIFKKSKLPRGVFVCCDNISKVRVQIQINRKQIYLGRYNSIREATQVYEAAAKKYFGEYLPK